MQFSVIIPVYNVEKYLDKCIQSVINQTYHEPYEILLVNDGSTDESEKICLKYQESYPDQIQYFYKENGGLGDARNYGILRARGKYVIFIDSDDYIKNTALQTIDEEIQKYGSDLIIYNMDIVDENGNLLYVDDAMLPQNKAFTLEECKELLVRNPSSCNKVVKRSLFLDHEILFPVMVWYEDLRTSGKLMLHAKKISYIKDSLYFYVKRFGSIMNNQNAKRNLEIIDAVEDIRGYLGQRGDLFKNELEYIALEKVYIDAPARVLKIGYDLEIIKQFVQYIERYFPQCHKTSYINRLNKKQKLILFLMRVKMYRIIHWIFKLKNI